VLEHLGLGVVVALEGGRERGRVERQRPVEQRLRGRVERGGPQPPRQRLPVLVAAPRCDARGLQAVALERREAPERLRGDALERPGSCSIRPARAWISASVSAASRALASSGSTPRLCN
jgi:hypothetical protein